MNLKQIIGGVLLAGTWVLATGAADAASISIVNPSFETVVNNSNTAACLSAGALGAGNFLNTSTNFGSPSGCVEAQPISGWNFAENQGQGSVFNPTGTSFFGGSAPDGQNIAGLSGIGLSQTLSTTWQPGDYTLTYTWGNASPATGYAGASVFLLNGNASLASRGTGTPSSGSYEVQTLTLTLNPGDANIGSAITIAFQGGSTSGTGYLDSVSLDFTSSQSSTPEPDSSLLGLAGLGVLALSRKVAKI